MPDISATIKANLAETRQAINAACMRSGRDPGSVHLVAVTKYADLQWVEALAAEHHVFGENRPQQLAKRRALLPDIQWHLIGQLQRNKVKLAVQNSAMIHSVDSDRLIQKIDSVAEDLQKRPKVLLQINVSDEETKSGFAPTAITENWIQMVNSCPHVDVVGLMTMAPATEDTALVRSVFRSLRQLRDGLQANHGVTLPELSMGMSGDFEIAIEEGATLVRIGSRLFDGLKA